MTKILVEPGELSEKLKRVLEEIVRVCEVDDASLVEFSADGKGPRVIAFAGAINSSKETLEGRLTEGSMTWRAYQTGKPVITNDYPNHPDSILEIAMDFGVMSAAAMPVTADARTLGIITVSSKKSDHFDDSRVNLLKAMIDGLGALLEKARLQEAEYLRTLELESLFHISKILVEPGELSEKLGRALGELVRVSNVDSVSLCEPDGSGQSLRLVASAGRTPVQLRVASIEPPENSITASSYNKREILVANDYPNHPYAIAHAVHKIGIRSFAAFPIVSGEKTLGVVAASSRQTDHFDSRRLSLLAAIVNGLGALLENARLQEAEHLRTRELETLLAIGNILNSPGEFDHKVGQVLQEVNKVAQADQVTLRQLDEQAGVLRLIGNVGTVVHKDCICEDLSIRENTGGVAAIHQREPVVINDYQIHPRSLPIYIAAGVQAAFFLPILAEDRLVGLMSFSSRIPAHFTPDRTWLLTAIGNGIGTLMENARLQEAEREQAWISETLFSVAQLLIQPGGYQEKVARVLDRVVEVLGVDRLVLGVPDSQGSGFHTTAAAGPLETTSLPSMPLSSSMAGLAFQEGRAIIANDYPTHPRAFPELVALGVKSLVSVPIRADDQTLGVLTACALVADYFTPERVRLLTAIGSGIGALLENARLQEAIRESEEQYRTLVDNANDAIAISHDGKWVFVNKALLQLLGFDHESQALGKPFTQSIVPEERELVRERAERRQRGETVPSIYDIQFRRADGEIRTIQTSAVATTYQGKPAVMASMRDVTELKNAQQQLIQQERLRALGEMAAGIAHDFNNELMAVLGFSELLLERPEDLDDKEKVTRDLQTINTAARDAAEVVRRLREFYRPLEDAETFAPIDLRHLVEQVISFTQPKWQQQAQSRGVDVKLETEFREVPLISGNEAELRELLTNLIFNAVDAMPSSGRITIRAYSQGEDVVLSVEDTGTGMTEEVRQRCMEPFFSTKGEEGSGLGLSLAYGVIQRHKGAIQIESEIGNGTTVIIRLPVQAGQQRGAIGVEVIAKTGALRVLAVDDQPISLQVVAGYLAADGHTVETATNGQEALEKFQAGEFDVVITDRAMPGMNGDQLAAMIKEATPKMPVILLTGFGDMILAKDESVENVAVIVGKPVTLAALREALAKAIEKGSAPF